ncbi:MAG: molybdenum cofactor biosynthesis protein MoaE [Chthoniobacterales bacterium]|nr:molybdenum cofactor biosynthesis protein MoaE [Chthoniobacterales bacterium]
MRTSVQLTTERLAGGMVTKSPAGCGAVVEFAGIVRAMEGGREIAGLDYEAYEPMARREIERILDELAVVHPCEAVEVLHRVGHVPAGEASILVRIEAAHRMEAFGLLEEFMIRLKRDVPIWKRVP